MTYPANPLDLSPSRRHRDPSTLWITVLVGSLAIHLFLLLAFRVYWSSIKVESEYSEIAVEFVEPSATDAPPASPTIAAPTDQPDQAAISPSPTAPEPATTTEVPVSTTAPPSEPDNSPVLTEPDPTAIAPATRPAPQPIPSSQSQPPNPLPRDPNPVSPPTTPSTIPPRSNPIPPRPNPSATAPATNPPAPTNNGPISTGQTLPPVPGISSDIDPTTQPTTAATDPATATAPRAPAPGQGTGLKLATGTLVQANPSQDILNSQQDVPEQEATLLADRPSDATAVYPPAVGLNFGKPVKLRILVNIQGKVERVEVQQSSGIPEYDDWARQMGQKLQFQPASRVGQPLASEVDVEVSLEPL